MGICVFFLVRVVFKKMQKLSAGHLPQHRLGNRVGLSVVVDVHVHPVHHIEMRIGKQFFHRCVFDLWRNLAGHELGVVGVFGETLYICHRRGWFLRRSAIQVGVLVAFLIWRTNQPCKGCQAFVAICCVSTLQI